MKSFKGRQDKVSALTHPIFWPGTGEWGTLGYAGYGHSAKPGYLGYFRYGLCQVSGYLGFLGMASPSTRVPRIPRVVAFPDTWRIPRVVESSKYPVPGIPYPDDP